MAILWYEVTNSGADTSDRFILSGSGVSIGDHNSQLGNRAVMGQTMKSPRKSLASKLVVVIDDDPLVLEATGGLLRSWGCRVVTAETYEEALAQLRHSGQRPDLIICDYRLPGGATGVDVIEGLRSAFEIPALLISGDAGSPSGDGVGGYHLLHKPVDETTFRTALIGASVLQRQHQGT